MKLDRERRVDATSRGTCQRAPGALQVVCRARARACCRRVTLRACAWPGRASCAPRRSQPPRRCRAGAPRARCAWRLAPLRTRGAQFRAARCAAAAFRATPQRICQRCAAALRAALNQRAPWPPPQAGAAFYTVQPDGSDAWRLDEAIATLRRCALSRRRHRASCAQPSLAFRAQPPASGYLQLHRPLAAMCTAVCGLRCPAKPRVSAPHSRGVPLGAPRAAAAWASSRRTRCTPSCATSSAGRLSSGYTRRVVSTLRTRGIKRTRAALGSRLRCAACRPRR